MVIIFETGIFVDYLHTLCNIITIWSCFLGSLDQLTVDGIRNFFYAKLVVTCEDDREEAVQGAP